MAENPSGEKTDNGQVAPSEAVAASEAQVTPVASNAIVVGFDGSGSSRDALAKAFELADDLRRPVTVVRTWTIDTLPHGTMWKDGYVASYEEITEVVRQHTVQEAAATVAAYPGVEVDYLVTLGHPAEVLVRTSEGAFMLVLGSRGRGGFAGMLLGSVSDNCVRHAKCPVLVVRH